jgi:hypothetical protein
MRTLHVRENGVKGVVPSTPLRQTTQGLQPAFQMLNYSYSSVTGSKTTLSLAYCCMSDIRPM